MMISEHAARKSPVKEKYILYVLELHIFAKQSGIKKCYNSFADMCFLIDK